MLSSICFLLYVVITLYTLLEIPNPNHEIPRGMMSKDGRQMLYLLSNVYMSTINSLLEPFYVEHKSTNISGMIIYCCLKPFRLLYMLCLMWILALHKYYISLRLHVLSKLSRPKDKKTSADYHKKCNISCTQSADDI